MRQKRKYYLYSFLVVLSIVINFNTSNAQANKYVALKAGFGLPYGAYGLNVEYRYYQLGGYVGGGFMKTQYYRDIEIPSSINGALGLKYYFFRLEDPLHPIIGIHAGWLNNYYHKDIGEKPYGSTVYGMALIGGVELTENFARIEMSMMIDPGVAILHPDMHPSYTGKIYFSPTIGVGVNLYAIRRYYKYRERNKKRKEERDSYIEDSKGKNEIKNDNKVNNNLVFIEKIKSECNDTVSFPAVKTLVADIYGNLLAGKQIAEDSYLFVRFSPEENKSGKIAQVFQIDSNATNLKVFIIKSNKSDQTLSNLAYLLASDGQTEGIKFDAVKGIASFYYYKNAKNEISIKLNDLKLVDKAESGGAELYYDEILICLVAEKK